MSDARTFVRQFSYGIVQRTNSNNLRETIKINSHFYGEFVRSRRYANYLCKGSTVHIPHTIYTAMVYRCDSLELFTDIFFFRRYSWMHI